MPVRKNIYLAVLGTGGVGQTFLAQLQSLPKPPLLIYLATAQNTLFSEDFRPLALSDWSSQLARSQQPRLPPHDLASYLALAPGRVVLIDNTAAQEVAEAYPEFLKKGISICTPNKKAFSGTWALWNDIWHAAANSLHTPNPTGGFCYHESSVGAGLPIISTINDLVATGDKVTKIEGIFSGTMSFLFNNFAPVSGVGGGKFSDEVKKAKKMGFTEPDPRDDLNGLDVARKVTILARLAGVRVEGPTSFPVQSLIPAPLASCRSGDEFLDKLHEYDSEMEKVKKAAEAEGKVVRFVGSVDVEKGTLKVGLEKFDKSSAIANLKGSDNIISFYTRRYGANPLIVQGAGAGGEVTAMGVLGDLLKVMQRLH
ncbi:MAG: hypothetical protein M1834_009035 [Cirrosporium novae-zelandiae]|nr:MAG: hypothetical protein M1834_009035 [Cirrosporium novae-zelandiae]